MYTTYSRSLRETACELRRRYGPDGPPYDPFLIARRLGVRVTHAALDGTDGYVQVRDGQWHAVISSRSNLARQRFTLGHELGHVILMRGAQRGEFRCLTRYRTHEFAPGVHQDPLEEALCNAFADELLLPADEILDRFGLDRSNPASVVPCVVFEVARAFGVSVQAAAVKVVKMLGARRTGCCLWDLETLWPVALWWTGLRLPYTRNREKLQSLIGMSVKSRTSVMELWKAKEYWTKVQTAITPRGRFALVLLRRVDAPMRAARTGRESTAVRPQQGELFSNTMQAS